MSLIYDRPVRMPTRSETMARIRRDLKARGVKLPEPPARPVSTKQKKH